jgi:hypothetical protein
MTKEQEEHLEEIQRGVGARLDQKYRVGQAEHGGDLWERFPLVEDLIDESIDQVTYALTLKSQLDRVRGLLEEARYSVREDPVAAQTLITRAMNCL